MCIGWLFRVERSTDQVAKPVNLDGLTSWVGHIPKDVFRDLDSIAPMLIKLGYDTHDPNPKYGEPDAIVRKNLRLLKEHPENYKVESYRIDMDGSILKGQPGQKEMAKAAEKHNLDGI